MSLLFPAIHFDDVHSFLEPRALVMFIYGFFLSDLGVLSCCFFFRRATLSNFMMENDVDVFGIANGNLAE